MLQDMVHFCARNLQGHDCLVTGALRFLLELLLFRAGNAHFFRMAILRVLIAANPKRQQQHGDNSHSPRWAVQPPRKKLSIDLLCCWLRAFGFGLVHPRHHPLSESFTRIFALERFTKIVFRKMHIEPLESCASGPCAGQPVSDAACSLRFLLTFPELRRSRPGPAPLETSKSPPAAAFPAAWSG